MKSYAVGLLLLIGFAVGLGCAGVVDQPADNVQSHIATAKAAAGQEHKGLFDRVCTFETEQPAASQSKGPPDRSKWHGAGKGLRQSLLRRPNGILRVGCDDIGRHHCRGRVVGLLGRG